MRNHLPKLFIGGRKLDQGQNKSQGGGTARKTDEKSDGKDKIK